MLNHPPGPLPTQGPAPSAVDTAVRAFAEILVHGAREYFKSPRFEELIGIVSQPPAPIVPITRPQTPDVMPLRGCPWCDVARHLAGIREDLVHAAESPYPSSFLMQAHQSAKELVRRIDVTGIDLGTIPGDVQAVTDRLERAVQEMDFLIRGQGAQPNPNMPLTTVIDHERQSIRDEVNRLITYCHAKSEEPVQRTPPAQTSPPGAANGQQRR